MTINRIAFIPLLAFCAGCHTGRALRGTIPSSPAVGIEDGRTERIGQVGRETMREATIPGLSLAVIDGGRVVWAQAFGWRDLEKVLPGGENIGYFAAFGASVSNGRGWGIMTNTEKNKLTPIIKAIGKEFGWATPPKRMESNG